MLQNAAETGEFAIQRLARLAHTHRTARCVDRRDCNGSDQVLGVELRLLRHVDRLGGRAFSACSVRGRPSADSRSTTTGSCAAYADHESAAEREQPLSLYPAILAEAFRRTGRSLGVAVDETWAARLGESVPDWPAFSDSSAALAALAEHYRLIIVSNVHRAGFAASNVHLQGDFAAIITAEDVGAYKPADNHFVALDRTLVELGIERESVAARRPEPVPRSRAGASSWAGVDLDQSPPRSVRMGRDARAERRVLVCARVRLDGRIRRPPSPPRSLPLKCRDKSHGRKMWASAGMGHRICPSTVGAWIGDRYRSRALVRVPIWLKPDTWLRLRLYMVPGDA